MTTDNLLWFGYLVFGLAAVIGALMGMYQRSEIRSLKRALDARLNDGGWGTKYWKDVEHLRGMVDHFSLAKVKADQLNHRLACRIRSQRQHIRRLKAKVRELSPARVDGAVASTPVSKTGHGSSNLSRPANPASEPPQ